MKDAFKNSSLKFSHIVLEKGCIEVDERALVTLGDVTQRLHVFLLVLVVLQHRHTCKKRIFQEEKVGKSPNTYI